MTGDRKPPQRDVAAAEVGTLIDDGPVRGAIAAVACWIGDQPARGTALAAAAIDRDAIGHLDAVAGLWQIVADVCDDRGVDVQAIIRDIALGVALAETEEHP